MGADKATLVVAGTPMAVRVASAVLAAGCDPVFAVGGDADALCAMGLVVVDDEFPGEGPLGGLITAITHAQSCDAVVVVACDVPWLRHDDVGKVVGALGDHDVAYAYTDRPEPLCAVWGVHALAAVRDRFAAGARSVLEVLASVDSVPVQLSADALRNVNTPDDLDLLR